MSEKTFIDEVAEKFLGWPIPKDFSPDCGISFDGRKDDQFNKNKQWPVGTNLFTKIQAKEMFEHCIGFDLIEQFQEDEHIIRRLSQLLAEIAVIVNGPEPPLTRWSYHDLPEKVLKLKEVANGNHNRRRVE